MKRSLDLRDGYTLLGIVLIIAGISVSFYFFYFSQIPLVVTNVSRENPSSPPPECTVTTTTSTEVNGTTHTHYYVACSQTLNISDIPNNGTATSALQPPTQVQLSSVTATISVVSTIGTVAVALTMLPLQGGERNDLKGGSWFSLLATVFLSLAVTIALFLILALPLNAIPTLWSLWLLFITPAFTLVGYGCSIVSWGRRARKDDSSTAS